jgi:hypothetical protein
MKSVKYAWLVLAAFALVATPVAHSGRSMQKVRVLDIGAPGPLADIGAPGPLAAAVTTVA